jgi:hypothetical protein
MCPLLPRYYISDSGQFLQFYGYAIDSMSCACVCCALGGTYSTTEMPPPYISWAWAWAGQRQRTVSPDDRDSPAAPSAPHVHSANDLCSISSAKKSQSKHKHKIFPWCVRLSMLFVFQAIFRSFVASALYHVRSSQPRQPNAYGHNLTSAQLRE